MRAPRWFLLAAALAAAPASAQTECRASSPPSRPPSPAQAARQALRGAIRDSLLDGLRDAARQSGVAQPSGIVLAELRAGSARVWTYRANLADSAAQRVFDRHAALLRRWPDRRERLINLRLDVVELPDSARVECTPSVVNLGEFQEELQRIGQRQSVPAGDARVLEVHVRMLVTRDGEVAFTELSRRSANGDVNRAVIRAAERLRFRPARVGGVPVDVWVEQPVQVAPRAF